jgi:GT2 family glycosyltransferase
MNMLDTSTTNIAIIVLNWNGIQDTLKCIASLLDQTLPSTIIIIDNGSTDGSIEQIKSMYANVVLLEQEYNLGFAGGVNVGINFALENNYTHIALFNNDATADKDWLKNLLAIINENTIGIATGLLLNSTGERIDTTGEFYSKWGLSFPRNRGENRVFAHPDGLVFGASGGATLYRSEMLRDIGLFDEDFFAYYEDADISFRAQLAGWKVKYTSEAIAYHKQGATSKKIPGFTVYQTFKNLPLLFLKNVPSGLLLSVGIRFYLAYLLMYVNTFRHKTGWAATKGVFKAFALTFRALRQRHTIQHNKRVTTKYIKSILWDDLPPDQTGLRKMRKLFTGK